MILNWSASGNFPLYLNEKCECFSRCWPLQQAADFILIIYFVAILSYYLVLAAAECSWLLLLFNLARGSLSWRVTIRRVWRTWHFPLLGAALLAWPRVWKCRRRPRITETTFYRWEVNGRCYRAHLEIKESDSWQSVCSYLWTVWRSPLPLFGTELLLRPLPHCKKK